MDSLKQWAICLIVGASAGTLVMALSPRGGTNKTLRAVVGIFIVAVIGAPFADMLKSGYAAETFVFHGSAESGDMREFMLDSFCESVKNKLENAASQAGVPLEEIFIEAEVDADNCIIIHKISAEISREFSDKSAEISEILSKNAGGYVAVITE